MCDRRNQKQLEWYSILHSRFKLIKIHSFVFVSLTEEIKMIQLHGFCNSSTEVYCAMIYIRVETFSSVKLSFLTSKTKVARTKILSVPHVDLLGWLLSNQLIERTVLTVSGRLCVHEIFCWSFSEIALCWVKHKEKCWKPCVENQILAFMKVEDRDRWGHIPGTVPNRCPN